VLSAIVSFLFPSRDHMHFHGHQHLVLALKTDYNISPANSPDVVPISVNFYYKIISHVNLYSDRNPKNELCGKNAKLFLTL